MEQSSQPSPEKSTKQPFSLFDVVDVHIPDEDTWQGVVVQTVEGLNVARILNTEKGTELAHAGSFGFEQLTLTNKKWTLDDVVNAYTRAAGESMRETIVRLFTKQVHLEEEYYTRHITVADTRQNPDNTI